jgi:hypothetical protein
VPWRPLPAPLQARAWPTGSFTTSWSWMSHPCAPFLKASGPYTIEVCLYMGDTGTTSNYSSPLGLQSTVTTTAGHLFEYNPASGTEPKGVWYNQAAGVNINVGTVNMVISDWNYMAITFDGSTWRPYFRYSLRAPLRAGTTASSSTLAPVDLSGGVNVTLGGELFGPNGMNNGRIVFGRIWGRVLSQAELQLYSAVHLPPGKWRGMVFNYDAQNSDGLDSSTGLVETAYGLRSNVSNGNAQRPTAGPQMDSYPEDLGVRNNKWWFARATSGARTLGQALSASTGSGLLLPKQVQTTKALGSAGVLGLLKQVQTTKALGSAGSVTLVVSKVYLEALAAATASALALVKQPGLVRSVSSPGALALTRLIAVTKALASPGVLTLGKQAQLVRQAGAVTAVTLARAMTYLHSVSAAASAALTLGKQWQTTKAVASAGVLGLGKQVQTTKAVASAGVLGLGKQVQTVWLLASAGVLGLGKQVQTTKAVASASVLGLTRAASYLRSLSAASAGALALAVTRFYLRTLSAASASLLVLIRQTAKALAASAGQTATLVRQAQLVRLVVSATVPAIVQLRRFFRTLSGSGGEGASLGVAGYYARALFATTASAIALVKLVGKGAATGTAVVAGLVRQIGLSRATSTLGSARLSEQLRLSHLLSLSSPAPPALAKLLFHSFSAASAGNLTLTHALVQFFQRTLSVASPASATVAHVYAGIVSLLTGYAARLTSSITGAGTGGVATGPPTLSGFTARLVSTIQGWIGYDS